MEKQTTKSLVTIKSLQQKKQKGEPLCFVCQLIQFLSRDKCPGKSPRAKPPCLTPFPPRQGDKLVPAGKVVEYMYHAMENSSS